MGSLLYPIIIGAVIGVLARFFKPGADPMGWILTILLGIAGLVMLWVKEPPIVRDIEPVGSGDETVTTKGA